MPKQKNEPDAAASDTAPSKARVPVGYSTDLGTMYLSTVEHFLESSEADAHRGKVNLIFTSPPFILNRKKKYAHTDEEEYVRWLSELAPKLKEMLTPDGSIVMELGNAWKPGEPVMTTAVMEAFLAFLKVGDLELCQQFVWDNPARPPSPAQWVTVTRMRVKDSFTHVWWMAPSTRPKADNRRVLKPYSKAMEKLLERQSYNAGKRPSGHGVSKTGFLTRHEGAIASNYLEFPDDVDPETYEQYIPSNAIRMSNTLNADRYRKYCEIHELIRLGFTVFSVEQKGTSWKVRYSEPRSAFSVVSCRMDAEEDTAA